ncbi:hypothetical protein CLAVI_000682 [Candidatus Clavichlamydia salmonicola]|uniref:sulfite reductase n=1 Tax=Candidatus Clavichlamydia salmonicola TaxID=469812 RepID=UPI001891314A|nr:sulfite reductase [Candidatus Clavichlamydia salmonicola]MBF5051054.1 hypothetical protein [Candidatus Clavichlamydia salmonicola]
MNIDIFQSMIMSRSCLSGDLISPDKVYHLELKLPQKFPSYEVGDILGVYPENNPVEVDQILKDLGFYPDTVVKNKKGIEVTLRSFLMTEANIHKCQKTLSSYLVLEKEFISPTDEFQFLKTSRLSDLTKYLKGLSPQEFSDLLLPLLPRYYSVASSPKLYPNEVHLTVGLTVMNYDPLLYGVCTYFLCLQAKCNEQKISIFLKKSPHFHLSATSDSVPLIMIANGTGIAPFRAFMQERIARNASSKNFLFFGECHQELDFYYEEEWKEAEAKGILRVITAFSRDQEEKIYVQHRLLQESELILSLIEEGAVICVCGDAKKMARAVHSALKTILMSQKGFTEQESELYLKDLVAQKRYLKDVY